MPAKRSVDPAVLPPVRGGFVGRERELDRIAAFVLGPARLVTLVGSGGIGKTSLAEETVRRMHRARRTPVFCARLARLPRDADVASVREAVAGSVVAGGFAGASAWDGAVAALSEMDSAGRVVDSVLLLDNCEHVVAGAATVIVELLDSVPGLTILATSREPMGWVDEQLVAVPPLSRDQSLELFRLRAALAGHSISGSSQVEAAQQICGHMHGHPLCIRLAAARMFYEPLPMILAQLGGGSEDGRMRWRHGPRAGVESRHRSISEVIGWSYELCGDKERLLFDRLSVFAPGYDADPEDEATGVVDVGADLEAIEMICADDVSIEGCEGAASAVDGEAVDLARSEIRELLERLVERSLVSIHIGVEAVRYSLLESLRLFAAERLAERSTERIDEPGRLGCRHRYYYRDRVLQAQAQRFGPAEQELLTWGSAAWSNIQRAIDTSLHTTGDAAVGLQIAVGMLSQRGAPLVGSLPEIRGYIEQMVTATETSRSQSAELRVEAMARTVWLALLQGCPEDADELLERCVAACDADAARDGHWRHRPDIDIGLPAVVDFAWGGELMLAGHDPRAIAVLARAREKFHGRADRGGEAMSEMFEAMAAGFLGSAEQAMTIAQRHLERTTAAGAAWAKSWAQLMVAIALTRNGEAEEAMQLGRAALAYQLALGDPWSATWAVHIRRWSLARLITDQMAAGNATRSTMVKLAAEIAYLAGGLTTQLARLGAKIENLDLLADDIGAAEITARDLLGQDAYAALEKRGSGLFSERSELQRLASGTLSISTTFPATTTTSKWRCLSEAEREVALLAAAGWPNSAIGVRRGTSTKTADAQMSSILQKLMIASRADIAGFVPQDERNRVSAERCDIPRQSRDKPRSIQPRPPG